MVGAVGGLRRAPLPSGASGQARGTRRAGAGRGGGRRRGKGPGLRPLPPSRHDPRSADRDGGRARARVREPRRHPLPHRLLRAGRGLDPGWRAEPVLELVSALPLADRALPALPGAPGLALQRSRFPVPWAHPRSTGRDEALVPILEPWPELDQRRPQAAADEDGAILLLHPPGVMVLARLLHGRAEPLQTLPVVLEHYDHIPAEAPGAPEEIGLVRADRGGQPVARAEEVDGARLSVVVGEDGRARTLFGGEGGVNAGHLDGPLPPAVRVPLGLGERTAGGRRGLG